MNERLEALLAQMTLEEKVALLAGADMWQTVAIPRLGIPALKTTDGPIGARGEDAPAGPTSACLPCGSALAATWDSVLVQRVGRVLGEETRSKGAHILLAPTVNIHRSPLAGRNFEAYSEDPYLTGELATAFIRGAQSAGVGACIKHFVCNDSEYERTTMSSEVGERALREIYLRPFEMAIRNARPWAVMSSYNRVNGVCASENDHTLRDILKGEWGFDGIVMSDWWGTYSPNVVQGGLDLEMPGPARWMGEHALDGVRRGKLSEGIIDDKVRRILRTLERAGLLGRALAMPPEQAALEECAVDKPEHRAIARQAAAESIVLLKNDRGILPLGSDVKRIAVIGANARWAAIMGGGSVRVTPHYAVSPLEGIRERAPDGAQIQYAIGCAIHKTLPSLDLTWLKDGLVLEYFDNRELWGEPVRRDRICKANLVWFGTVEPPLEVDNFSIRLTGTFKVPEDGTYCFSLPTTSQNRLFIDDVMFINQWHPTPEMPLPAAASHIEEGNAVAEVALKAGQAHHLRVEYAAEPGTFWRNMRIGAMVKVPAHAMDDAIHAASESDVAVVFAGQTAEWESEGFDRPDMELPGEQVQLIERVAAANPNTVVVLNTGSPVTVDWMDHVAAVVHTGYLGQETGHAVADVLFGDVNPCGKLATTWPRRLKDNPAFLNYPGENGRVLYGEGIFTGYRYYDKKEIEPRLPFGYGLSYTTFEYRNLALAQNEPGKLRVTVEVANTGTRAGKEIVQVYVHSGERRGARVEYHALGPAPARVENVQRPEQELAAFAKVALEPGECKPVTLTLDQERLAYYSVAQHRWVAVPGEYAVRVGASSRDIRLSDTFCLAG